MAVKLTTFDPAEYLTDEESISAFLAESFESGDPAEIADALRVVARARGGIEQLAKRTGIAKDALQSALGDAGSTELITLLKVMQALGVRLTASVA